MHFMVNLRFSCAMLFLNLIGSDRRLDDTQIIVVGQRNASTANPGNITISLQHQDASNVRLENMRTNTLQNPARSVAPASFWPGMVVCIRQIVLHVLKVKPRSPVLQQWRIAWSALPANILMTVFAKIVKQANTLRLGQTVKSVLPTQILCMPAAHHQMTACVTSDTPDLVVLCLVRRAKLVNTKSRQDQHCVPYVLPANFLRALLRRLKHLARIVARENLVYKKQPQLIRSV